MSMVDSASGAAQAPAIQAGLVSVIMPAYNAVATIRQSIESVLAQSYPHIELIVVDDGSTDHTAELIKAYAPRVIYLHQANSGSCAAPRNTGLRECRGEFVAFLDSDDLWAPEHIAGQVDLLARHPEVGLVFSDYRNFDASGPGEKSHFSNCAHLSALLAGQREIVLDDPLFMLAEANFGIASSFLMRAELLNEVPGFDQELKACEDFHFYYRVARFTKVAVINEVGLLRRFHAENMSRDGLRMARAGLVACGNLLASERHPGARRELRRLMREDWHGLGRVDANQRRCFSAMVKYMRGLGVGRDLPALRETAIGVLRALAIFAHLHAARDQS